MIASAIEPAAPPDPVFTKYSDTLIWLQKKRIKKLEDKKAAIFYDIDVSLIALRNNIYRFIEKTPWHNHGELKQAKVARIKFILLF
ncbi:hypothetical protein [Nitrosomonas aestuarii]|uniref:hypothetical protein n=1 Tax=Nitrosomonas aestuarii TaxID=52441 RepID=UPI000D2F682B|nr:hypothetical protein [Nitrosomonas aestuarii]